MQRIGGNEVTEAAAAGKEMVLHSFHLGKSELPIKENDVEACFQLGNSCGKLEPQFH